MCVFSEAPLATGGYNNARTSVQRSLEQITMMLVQAVQAIVLSLSIVAVLVLLPLE
jgi:hypothetical protein